jgi:hypothetical protein
MKINIKFILTLLVSTLLGLTIYWIDSQPNWNDTGITATLIVLTSVIISYFYKSRPWLWGIIISLWIPLFGIMKSGDYMMLFILLFGLIGSFGGYFIHKLMVPAKTKRNKK